MTDDTLQLTAAIASGNAEAFSRLYRERFDAMLAQARAATRRDESFCLDVVQEAFMKVIRRCPAIESEAALGAWLRRLVLTSAYDMLRRERRLAQRDRNASASEAQREGEPFHAAHLEWLRTELAALDATSADLLARRYRVGATMERIGRAVGLKPGAVDGRLKRALRALSARGEEIFRDER